MTLSSAVLLGARQIYLSHFSQGIAPARLLMTQSVSSVVVFGIAGWLLESGAISWSGEFIAALLYQGVVIGGFGFIGNTWLLKRYLPSRVAATMLLAPIFGVIWSWVILGESVGLELALGVALLFVGSAIVQWPRQG
jgi:drug/metabolite transporter (DMT)-like permease